MTDKELKRLNRTELLQLLMNQVRETEQLQAKVQELTEQIQKHEITCQNAGTLAEAALALNGVFQAADEAAQKYVQEMADRAAKQEQELQAKAEEAKEQANKLLAEATDSADITREKAEAYETWGDENGEEQKRLICEETVVEEHVHTDSCFVTEEVPLENVDTLTCGQEEGETHTHTDRCYGTWVLVCGKEEHTHTEECTDAEGNLICELEEHVHAEECLTEPQLVTLDQDGAVVSELTYTGFGIQRNEESKDVEGNTAHVGDTVFFDITVGLASYDETVYHQGRVKMEFVLPYAAEQAVFDLTQMPWLDSSEGYAPVVIYLYCERGMGRILHHRGR